MASSSGPQPIRVRTLEILWHGRERDEEAVQLGLQGVAIEGIVSIDYHNDLDRIVTCGGDGYLRLWELHPTAMDAWLANSKNDMTACVRFIAGMRTSWMPLTARWSPRGTMIASAHCDGKICLWWRERRDPMEEVWKDYRHLSGHVMDVYDVCFSPDSRYLLSAGGDGSVVMHDLSGPTVPVVQLSEAHRRFCRGVAWDPWGRLVASFGASPALLVFAAAPRTATRRAHLAGQRRAGGDFVGESCATTFRRLGWSPDGALLAVPYAKAVAPRAEDLVHGVCVYTRAAPERPAGRWAVRGYAEVRGVRWAPSFLPPLPEAARVGAARGAWGPADYRMLLAAWTADAVVVYTTDSAVRHSDYTDLHMRSIADVAWSPTARYLLTAALDGYVTVIAVGDTLGAAQRLPLFSTRPVTVGICQLLTQIADAGEGVERSRWAATMDGGVGVKGGNGVHTHTDNAAAPGVTHAAVKKKRRVETAAPTDTHVQLSELVELMDAA